MELAARIGLHLEHDGIVGTLRRCIACAKPEVFGLYRLANLPQEPSAASVEIQRGVDALLRLRAPHSSLPYEYYCERRQGFQCCLCAVVEGQLAGVIWIAKSPASHFIRLNDEAAEITCLHVLPQFRGRGIAKRLYWNAAAHSLSSGARGVFAVIAADNHASRRAAEAVGFKKIAQIRRAALWGPKFSPNIEEALGRRREATAE
ncbi:MAG: GNAT family N-acetyltransferase [Armatimonadota bacterium]